MATTMIGHSRVLPPFLHDGELLLTLSPSPSPSPLLPSSLLSASSCSVSRRSFSIGGQSIHCENGGTRCGRNGGKVAVAAAHPAAKGLAWRHFSSFSLFGTSHRDLTACQLPQRRRGGKGEGQEQEEGRYGAGGGGGGGGFGCTSRPVRASASPSAATSAPEFNSRQMLIFVPPHPLIKHWIAVLRNEATPPTIFRGALAELGRLLIYEATRDWMPLVDIQMETPLGEADVSFVDPSKPIKLVPILRAGVVMLEEASSLLPASETYHVGYNKDDQTLLPSLVCCPTGLQKLTKYEGLRVYAGIIDPDLNSKGMIVPGIGNAGDRSFGT